MSARSLWSDPVTRLTLVMSLVFCGNGVGLPFLSVWLESERGLTGVEIGAVASAAQMTRIVVGPMLATWADGFADRRTPLRIFCVLALAGYAAFFSVHGFWALLALGFAATTMHQAMTPLIEGAALRASQTGRIPFGVSRAIASCAFILGNVAGGALVAQAGAGMVAAWILACLALASAAAFRLLPDPAPRSAAGLGFRGRLGIGATLLMTPRFALIVLGAGCIQAAHGFYYSFSVLTWRGQGLSDATTGFLWAFGAGIEVLFLMALPQIEKRFGPEALLVMGAGAACVRWAAMALAPPLLVLWPLQALHALTFAAAHVGALRLVMRSAPEEVQGLAQTFYAATASGVLIGLAILGSGFLYERYAAGGYWAMAALAAAGLALVLRLKRA